MPGYYRLIHSLFPGNYAFKQIYAILSDLKKTK